MNTCSNCGKVAGGQSNILQGCVCQYSMQAPPQPKQEPVEWPRTMERGALVQWLHFEMVQHTLDEGTIDKLIEDAQAIPATPPQRTWVKLTDEENWKIATDCTIGGDLHADKFARAIESRLKELNT